VFNGEMQELLEVHIFCPNEERDDVPLTGAIITERD
jgi:hypothetical protein